MSNNNIIESLNFDSHYSYQLLKNDIIDVESDSRITSYSILANVIENNCVKHGAYICDVSRDIKMAKYIFFEIAYGRVDCELLEEAVSEML